MEVIQMNTQPHRSARWFYKFIAAFFVVMTLAFLSIPLALGRHPGESQQYPIVAEHNATNLNHRCL